jgi:hypothetical protein
MIPGLPKRPRLLEFRKRALTLREMKFLGEQKTLVGLELLNCPIRDAHIRPLAQLPRLVNLGLSGTLITDRALAFLARLPKLSILNLSHTRITGTGLRHFHGHPSLETLWLNQTRVSDTGVRSLIRIPRLSVVRLGHTAVTFKGLLSLAGKDDLNVVSDGQFTPGQMRDFEAAQRNLASGPDVASDGDAARQVLLDFFDAMNQWERSMAKASNRRLRTVGKRSCSAIFKTFCTPKPRSYGKPNVLSMCHPPEHLGEKVVDVRQPSKSKVIIYTKDRTDIQQRYHIVKYKGAWRIDHREWQIDGWSPNTL